MPLRPCDRGRPYSVLLPVGFTVPPPLPGVRCALAAPFRPCPRDAFRFLRGRFVFCGTVPGVALAGCWPAPHSRGARTFLCRFATTAAVRPSGKRRDACAGAAASSSIRHLSGERSPHDALVRAGRGTIACVRRLREQMRAQAAGVPSAGWCGKAALGPAVIARRTRVIACKVARHLGLVPPTPTESFRRSQRIPGLQEIEWRARPAALCSASGWTSWRTTRASPNALPIMWGAAVARHRSAVRRRCQEDSPQRH